MKQIKEYLSNLGQTLDMIGYQINYWVLKIINILTIIVVIYEILAYWLPLGLYSDEELNSIFSMIDMVLITGLIYSIIRLCWMVITYVFSKLNIFRWIAPAYIAETVPENRVQLTRYERPLTKNDIMNSHGIGHGYIAYTDRPLGAVITINKDLLIYNKTLIKQGIITRDSELRSQQFVYGYDDNPNPRKYGAYYLWHRTHMLPFRYGLSELGYVMFTGTGHLNSGDRPQIGFFRDKRNQLREDFIQRELGFGSGKPKYDKDLSYFKSPKTQHEKDTHYSLDDYERLADFVINSHPQSNFNYSVECVYGKSKYRRR